MTGCKTWKFFFSLSDGHTVSQPISVRGRGGGYFASNTAATIGEQSAGSILSPQTQNAGIRLVYDVLSSSPATLPKDVELRRRMQQMSLQTSNKEQSELAHDDNGVEADRNVPKSDEDRESSERSSHDRASGNRSTGKADGRRVDQILEEGG